MYIYLVHIMTCIFLWFLCRPQQTQPLNLCNSPYNPSMYMSSGYQYPQSLGYPYPPPMNHGGPTHDPPGMNHSAIMAGPSHLPAFSKAPLSNDQGQDLSQSSVNPMAPSPAISSKLAPPTSAEDDDYDAWTHHNIISWLKQELYAKWLQLGWSYSGSIVNHFIILFYFDNVCWNCVICKTLVLFYMKMFSVFSFEHK